MIQRKGQRAWQNSPNPWRFWSLWIILGYWSFLNIFFTQTNAVSNLWLCSSIINRIYTSRKLTLPPKMWHFIRNCHLPTSIFQGTCYFFGEFSINSLHKGIGHWNHQHDWLLANSSCNPSQVLSPFFAAQWPRVHWPLLKSPPDFRNKNLQTSYEL